MAYQFTINSITGQQGDEYGLFFTCAMVSTCAPLFDTCEDNYDVEAKLIAAEVIDSTCEADSEFCGLWVSFRTAVHAALFIERLNDYLVEKEALLASARAY